MEMTQWPALATDRVPTGNRHHVGVDDLFFSTTNDLGVITEANSVFVRLSRFDRRQLMGAPHNIIRHPVMPQGAFKLMWDTLQAGEPFCAYVDNLAADGSTYRVFATITPIADGYLSVRTRPMRDDLADAAFALYGPARRLELEARAEGMMARQAAGVGLASLASGLAGAGFASYDEFIWVALPAEVEARSAQAFPLLERPEVAGPLRQMLTDTIALGRELAAQSGRQADLSAVAARLAKAVPQLEATISDAESTADEITRVARGNPGLAPIMLSVTLWTAMMAEIHELTQALIGDLAALRASSARTRFRVALAALHTDTIGQFINELIDDPAPDMWGEDAIDMLCGATAEGMDLTRTLSSDNARLAGAASSSIRQLADLLAVPRDLIANWQTMIANRSDEAITRLVPVVAGQLEASGEAVALLTSLADEVARVATPPDLDRALQLLASIEESVAAYATPSVAPRRGM